MKINKTIVSLFLLLGLISTNKTFAQMASSKKIAWDIDKKVDVNVSQNTAWEFLNDVKMLKQLSNGYVTSATKGSKGNLVSINLVFLNGIVRTETIVQTDIVNKFMVIEISKESLPKGVINAEIAIFTNTKDDGNSSVNWKAKIDGENPGKQILMDQLNTEIGAYTVGFGKI